MNNWQTKKLGEVCDVIAGQSPEGKFYNEKGSGLPFYQGKKEFTKKFIGEPTTWTTKITKKALENDILMSVRAPVGPINFATQKICIGRGLAGIRVKNEINKDLLFYFLGFKEKEICGNAGAIFASISKTDIENIQIPLPPLPEQHRIVKILDEVFTDVAKAKENAEKNLKNAKELFESYLQSVFANPGKDWEEKRLGEVCDFFNGKAHEKVIDKNGEYVVVNSKFISSEGQKFKKTKKMLFPMVKGDIAMVMSDVPKGKTLAKCFLVDKDNTYTLNQRICIFRSNKFDKKFLFYQLNRNKYFLSFDNKENQSNLRKNDILNCPIFIPAITTQKSVVTKLDALSAETRKLETIYRQKLADLEELKKSVLKKAFNGEL